MRPFNVGDRRCSFYIHIGRYRTAAIVTTEAPSTSCKLELREGTLPDVVRLDLATSVGPRIMLVRVYDDKLYSARR